MPRADMLRANASGVGSMWGRVVAWSERCVDVEEDSAGDVAGEVAGVGIDGGLRLREGGWRRG